MKIEYKYEPRVSEDGMEWRDALTGEPPKLSSDGRLLEPFVIQWWTHRERWMDGKLPLTHLATKLYNDALAAARARKEDGKATDEDLELLGGSRLHVPAPKRQRPKPVKTGPGPSSDRLRYVQGFREAMRRGGKEAVEVFKREWKAARAERRAASTS